MRLYGITWPALVILLSLPLVARTAGNDMRMVVTAAFVSEKGMPVYEDMARYLSEKIGVKIVVVSDVSYDEADQLLQRGIIQVGFVCGLPYTHNAREGTYELVAIPVMAMRKGQYPDASGYEDIPGKYYSYTIVRKDSPLSSWEDLKGKSFVYNEQNSNSGYNMPRYKLVQLGAKSWEDYFSKIMVSGSHEESIRLVSRGVVDASSVDSLVLDHERHLGDPNALNVKIIEELFPGGAGIPPVVINAKAEPRLRVALQNALVTMHEDPEGRRILDEALMLRFDPPDDSNYNDIRQMEEAARAAGFRDYVE